MERAGLTDQQVLHRRECRKLADEYFDALIAAGDRRIHGSISHETHFAQGVPLKAEYHERIVTKVNS